MGADIKIKICSVVPSPYQRDLFREIAITDGVDLTVYYLEDAAPDSPWGKVELLPWEKVLGGYCFGKARIRSHISWGLPKVEAGENWIINTALTDITTQYMLRRIAQAKGVQSFFWGELIRSGGGVSGTIRKTLARPIQKLDGIIAIGKRAMMDYKSRFPKQELINLPYHCELESFVSASNSNSTNQPNQTDHATPLRLLFCGQMIHRKGVDVLLEAFDRLVSRDIDLELALVGREASLHEFMNEVSEKARSKINFLGFKEVSELPAIFAESDVFVLPSRHDGWGVVINQAIGAGLAIITTDRVGAAVDLIQHDENGLLVEAGNCDELEASIERLASDRELVCQFQEQNRKKRIELNPSVAAKKLVDFVASVKS